MRPRRSGHLLTRIGRSTASTCPSTLHSVIYKQAATASVRHAAAIARRASHPANANSATAEHGGLFLAYTLIKLATALTFEEVKS